MKKLMFEQSAQEDLFFLVSNDIKIVKRILDLIENIQQSSFTGIGKPEPLKHKLKGFWSRRITDEHRLVYKVTEEMIIIASCRYHYS